MKFVRTLIKPMKAEKEILYGVVHKNNTFKLQITLDRRNLRLQLNYCLLTHPPLFLLLSTFTGKTDEYLFFQKQVLPEIKSIYICDISDQNALQNLPRAPSRRLRDI